MFHSSGPRQSKRAWDKTDNTLKQILEQDLQAALNSAFNPHPNSHKKAVALLIRFEEDNLGCEPFEDELAKTFVDFYNYKVERCLLRKSQDPNRVILQTVANLQSHGFMDKGCLLILVFSGHGHSELRLGKYVHLGGALDKSGNICTEKLRWASATSGFDYDGLDVLHILDCCYAAEAYTGTAEILAATSMTEKAASSHSSCFSRALNEELRRRSSEVATVAGLHAEMMRNRTALKWEYAPFYAERRAQSSIVLRRLGSPGNPKPRAIPRDGTCVLVSARLKDISDFKKWLLTWSPDKVVGMDVKLEGVWDSASFLLLLSLPIEIWTQLSNNPAYSFVGFVNFSNKLLDAPQSFGALAARPAPGPENTRPGFGFGSGSK